MSNWDSPENAVAYARFCREFPLYRDTSKVLASLVGLETAKLAIDLACGTGASTQAILARLPQTGKVIALDGSAAMLSIAQREVVDPRVRWLHVPGEQLAGHVGEGADAVVCNSAFWQMDMPAVAGVVRRALRPGGRFAFNIGGLFIRLPPSPDEPQRTTPTLFELMWAAAVLNYGFVAPRPRLSRDGSMPPTIDSITALLEAAGFEVEQATVMEYDNSPESMHAWLSIPVFTERHFAGLPYEHRMNALATAYDRLDRRSNERSRWAVFAARALPG